MKDINLTLKDINVNEVLKKEVMKFGKSGHIIIPQRHLNKKVFVVIPE